MWARTAVPRAPAPLTGRDPAELALRGNAGRRREAALPAEAFKEFFRIAYQSLPRDVIFAGGNPHEAQDAVSAAMAKVLRRWDTIKNPRAYASRAPISNLIKTKQQGLQRIQKRLVRRDNVSSSMTWIPVCQSGNRGRRHDTREEAR